MAGLRRILAGMRPAAGLLLLGVMLVLVAGTFDAEALYVPGVAFVLLALLAVAWVVIASRGVTITRRLDARRVVEDEALGVLVEIAGGRLPLPGAELADPLLDDPVALGFGRAQRRTRIRARFGRRGRRTLAAPKLVVRDPLGLASLTITGTDDDELLVLPRIEAVRPLRAGDTGRARRKGRPAMAAEVELDGVREHRLGTPASRIYWPALARGAGLMERRLRAESDSRPMIVLDARGAERDEDLDAAVRAAASLAVSLARDGGSQILLPGDRRPTALDETLGGWVHLHARLALVQGGGRASLTGIANRLGPVIYVCPHVPSRAPRALEHAP
ncbi:MAG: hypothetical protein AVDCRST_MAG85-2230, partial [uncultured Solirubrobacteraceae bacterium]